MEEVKTVRFYKIFKVLISFMIPISAVIYVLTAFMNISLISIYLGDYLIKFRIAVISSIVITLLTFLLTLFRIVLVKNIFKKKHVSFAIALLMLIESCLWVNLSHIEISMEGFGSFSVDLSSLFIVVLVLLSIYVSSSALDLIFTRESINDGMEGQIQRFLVSSHYSF